MKIIHGDCLDEMKKMDDNSIDFIVTDPPYGISFMGCEFDKFKDQPAFNPEYWKEALRICKPGSMLAAFGGDRTHHHLMNALEKAGWTIRTCLYWLTGQGFPKSYQFGKKLGPEWHGYGTALKPAAEIIVLAMKKLDGGFKENAEKWGVGGINIDSSRIFPVTSQVNNCEKNTQNARWPSHLLLDEEAAEQLDEMTGILKSGGGIKNPIGGSTTGFHNSNWKDSGYIKPDSGGASRFFYCVKASPNERKNNSHPMIKPIKLMKYIIKLLSPPGNPILLDPFCGSGSTLVAAKELGIDYIGIEKEMEYVEITRKKLEIQSS